MIASFEFYFVIYIYIYYIYVIYDLDFSTTASYNSSLRTHLSVIIVDAIEFESEISKVDTR